MPKVEKNYVIFTRIGYDNNQYLEVDSNGYHHYNYGLHNATRFTLKQAIKIKNQLVKNSMSKIRVYGYHTI